MGSQWKFNPNHPEARASWRLRPMRRLSVPGCATSSSMPAAPT